MYISDFKKILSNSTRSIIEISYFVSNFNPIKIGYPIFWIVFDWSIPLNWIICMPLFFPYEGKKKKARSKNTFLTSLLGKHQIGVYYY